MLFQCMRACVWSGSGARMYTLLMSKHSQGAMVVILRLHERRGELVHERLFGESCRNGSRSIHAAKICAARHRRFLSSILKQRSLLSDRCTQQRMLGRHAVRRIDRGGRPRRGRRAVCTSVSNPPRCANAGWGARKLCKGVIQEGHAGVQSGS